METLGTPQEALLQVLDKHVLKTFVPLNTLSETALQQLLSVQQVRAYSQGEVIFTAGSINRHVAYLLSGQLQRGEEQNDLISAVGPASWHPVCSGDRHKHTLVAHTDVLLLLFDRQYFDEQLALEQALKDVLFQLHKDPAYAEDLPWIERFLHLPLFRQLPSANIITVLERLSPERHRRGSVIVAQGQAADACYVIKSGACEVTVVPAPDASPVAVATLEAGQWFGEEALLVQGKRNATVTAMEDAVVMRLSVKDFDELLKKPIVKRLSLGGAEEAIRHGARWVDVRTAGEFQQWHLPKAIHLPLQHVRAKHSILSRNLRYVVYCDTGRRSAAAAFLLQELGINARWLAEPVPLRPHL